MRGSRNVFIPALSILLFLFPAFPSVCVGGDEPAPPRLEGQIVLGATFPLTGHLETYGQSAYYGAETRVRLINESGGVNGKRLVLEWRDNRSDPVQAARDVRELVEKHGAPAILGPLLSDATMAARPVADRLGVVLMTPMATMDAVTRDTPWVFRSCFTNSAQADGLIRFQMEKYGAKKMGILYDSSHASSLELANIFYDNFTGRDGECVGKLSFIGPGGEKDYKTPLRELARENPDFIFAPSYALEATEIIRAAREFDVSIRFCGPDTWDNELVFDASGSRLTGSSFASTLFEQTFSYRPFRIFFDAMEQAGMDNPDAPAACAYDAVTLLATALANGETPEKIREGLLQVKRMPLATGRVTINADGDAVKPVLIRVVEQSRGRLLPVYAERYDP